MRNAARAQLPVREGRSLSQSAPSPIHRTGRKDKLFLDLGKATSTWQSICPSKVAIWEKVSFIPAEQRGAAARPISGGGQAGVAHVGARAGGPSVGSPGGTALALSCPMGTYTCGDKSGLSSVTRALLTVLSPGNLPHGKYLGSGGSSCPHQPPTRLACSLGDVGAGGMPRLGSQAPAQVGQGGFSVQGRGLPAISWEGVAAPSPPRRCSSSPAAHPSPDRVPVAQCYKAPGLSLHQQSSLFFFYQKYCLFLHLLHIETTSRTQRYQSGTCPQLQKP